jgi:hypothetical protein
MKSMRLLGIMGALCAVAVLTGSVGAGAARTPTRHAINLSTNAAVKQYLRSLGISPRGVVIQRGARNYAGPECPGKGWNCTRSQRVVQIATPTRARASVGARTFLGNKPPPPTNVMKCSRTTGTNQSCTVVQDATAGTANLAQVDETISQSGQTLNGSQDAQIMQTSVNGANQVQLDLSITQTATTAAPTVSQGVTSTQNFNISQTSTGGGAQSIQVKHSSTQSETANSATSGSQFAGGDLTGHITQSSTGVSTAKIRQTHNITQSALGPNVDQTAIDPMKCCATQSGNPNNTLGLNQSGSVQTTGDATPNISAVYQADCQSSGNCTVTETQNTNGTTSQNTSSGSTVSTGFNCTGTTCTQGSIAFDGSPGTAAPPATLGPYTMTPFGDDGRPEFDMVSDVPDPAGTIGFSPSLSHRQVPGSWATWSHGYTSDVYFTGGPQITITLPAGTKAFYFYAEPEQFAVFSVQATAQDGTTSGPIPVQGEGGAQYFGFYGTGAATLASITVTTADPSGFAVGEFGINPAAGPVIP